MLSTRDRFEKRFNARNKEFNRMSSFIKFVFMVVFGLVLCIWILYGVIACEAFKMAKKTDWSGGVKPVLEKIWCGEEGCLDRK